MQATCKHKSGHIVVGQPTGNTLVSVMQISVSHDTCLENCALLLPSKRCWVT